MVIINCIHCFNVYFIRPSFLFVYNNLIYFFLGRFFCSLRLRKTSARDFRSKFLHELPSSRVQNDAQVHFIYLEIKLSNFRFVQLSLFNFDTMFPTLITFNSFYLSRESIEGKKMCETLWIMRSLIKSLNLILIFQHVYNLFGLSYQS